MFSLVIGLLAAALSLAPADTREVALEGEPLHVAILTFTGDEATAAGVRVGIEESLVGLGYAVHFIKRSRREAMERNACVLFDGECMAKIGLYLAKNTSRDYAYFIWGDVPADGPATLGAYGIFERRLITHLAMNMSPHDRVLPRVMAPALARRVHDSRVPPAPPTDEELAVLASLDADPPWTRRDPLPCNSCGPPSPLPAERYNREADLREDFNAWCRVEPRDDEAFVGRDLRPHCRQGPVFGYFRPRTWTLLGLTGAAAVGTGVVYGLAAAAATIWDADTGRALAISGHATLATTLALGTALAIVIAVDRAQARKFIEGEMQIGDAGLRLRASAGGVALEF